ncbi:caspase family protein [Polycyclovorans algicola]|uniref:caspase family protein n=1 Tax=Polycyclovorans algicola TaxID=616992 RepID=UPI0004A6BBEB|nr:caspase family protein [Polycyclovorans algicola]
MKNSKGRWTTAIAAHLLMAISALNPALAENRALVIAIGDYRTDPAIRPLGGPTEDARLVHSMLSDPLQYKAENIKVLLDAEATRAGILNAIDDWLIKGTQSGDRVFLHFSGHGAQTPDLNGDEEDGLDEVLVAYDARVNRAERRLENVILDDEIEVILKRLEGRIVTVVIDACHSGTITRSVLGLHDDEAPTRTPMGVASLIEASARSLVVTAHREEEALVAGGQNQTVWTAVSSFQEALDDVETRPRTGHFTNRFVQGVTTMVANANRDGQIAHSELLAWLRSEAQSYCKRVPQHCRTGLLPTLEIDAALLTQPIQTTLLGRKPMDQDTVTATEIALTPPTNTPDETTLSVVTEVVANQQPCRVPGCSLQSGQTVSFRTQSNFDGYLTLLNIDPAGQFIQLFPNSLSVARNREGRIQRDQPLNVPDAYYGFEFTAEPPLGNGRLIALVTQDPVDLSDIVDATRSLSVVPEEEATDILGKLAERLRKPWTGGELNREARWAVGVVDYRVE